MAQKNGSKTKPKAAKSPVKAAAKPVAKTAAKPAPQVILKKQAKPSAPVKSVVPGKSPAPAKSAAPAKSVEDKKPSKGSVSLKAKETQLEKAHSVEKPAPRKAAPEVADPGDELLAAEPAAFQEPEEPEEEPRSDDDIVLTDAEGRRYCKVKDCDQYATVEDHCRFHYLLLWKRIQVRRKILVDGKLERYVEELTARYPDKFLEMIRKDLRSEKDFHAAIAELEIDESENDSEFEDENSSFIEEVRGMSSEGGSIDSDDAY